MQDKKDGKSHIRIAVVNDIEQGPADRLRDARKIAKGGFFKHAADAARFFGWNPGNYRGHESGTRNYGREEAITYGRAFGVTPGWLLFGEGINHTSQNLRKRPTIAALALPLLKFSDFGSKMIDLGRIIEGAERFVEVPAIVDFSKLAFTLTAEDDSMVQIPPNSSLSPGDNFPQGSFLPFDPQSVIRPGDYVLAKFDGRETLFRKYREVGTDEKGNEIIELIPLNTNFPPRRGVLNQNIFVIARLQADFRKR